MNVFINTPTVVEADSTLVFTGSNSLSKSCIACNGGWLFAPMPSGVFRILKAGRYLVNFTAQVTGTTAVELSINNDGVQIPGTAIAETLAAATDTAMVSGVVEINVPACLPFVLSVQNTSDAPVTINAASLSIQRVA